MTSPNVCMSLGPSPGFKSFFQPQSLDWFQFCPIFGGALPLASPSGCMILDPYPGMILDALLSHCSYCLLLPSISLLSPVLLMKI